MKVIESKASNRVGIDQDLLRAPVQATTLGDVQACTSSDEKKAKELDVSVTESLCESLRSLEVIEIVKPISELAEPVLDEHGKPLPVNDIRHVRAMRERQIALQEKNQGGS